MSNDYYGYGDSDQSESEQPGKLLKKYQRTKNRDFQYKIRKYSITQRQPVENIRLTISNSHWLNLINIYLGYIVLLLLNTLFDYANHCRVTLAANLKTYRVLFLKYS